MSTEEHGDWPEDATRDELVADWHLYQRRGGHRSSTDDVLVAWLAVREAAVAPRHYLDLGCGVGSVLLLVCHALRPQQAVGIEAQAQSLRLLRRSVAELPAGAPAIQVLAGDFRQHDLPHGHFDCITASPPYFPLGTGVEPKDSQRRACRFEVRGGVEAYLEVMAAALHPAGRGYLVYPIEQRGRLLAAAEASKLSLRKEVRFVMRRGRRTAFLGSYELGVATAQDESCSVEEMVIREPSGEFSEAFSKLREALRARRF